MEIKRHALKTWPEYFWPVMNGEKPFEIRENDRNYQVGDYLELLEWDPNLQQFSGKNGLFTVTYVTDFAQQPGWVVMGIKSVGMTQVNPQTMGSILGQVQQDLGGRVVIEGLSHE